MLEEKLKFAFNNAALLERALTHPSLGKGLGSYERLELLGDAVLGLVVSAELFDRYPTEAEGELTKRLSGLICGDTLVKVAQNLQLGEHIKMSDSERVSGGCDNRANLENAMEALIGAAYLDQGFDAAKAFVLQHWSNLIDQMLEPPKDAKSALQEWAQGRGLPLPEYAVVRQDGPSHAPEFEIAVSVQGFAAESAVGSSKREAEQGAAKKLLEIVEKN